MIINDELKSAVIATLQNPQLFEALALEVFHFQASQNEIYKKYLENLNTDVSKIKNLIQIPFLPIQFFKNHPLISGNLSPQLVFESSGTTGQVTSKHYVNDLPFYEYISRQIFEQFYGSLSDYHILALLPSYLERNNSSLVYMVQNFIFHSNSEHSGFYLNNTAELVAKLRLLSKKNDKKVLLIGVTFALLDWVDEGHDLSFLKDLGENLIVMETGGMKGRRKELLREEVHKILTEKLPITKVHSEYGMTELLSQGYSQGDGVFKLPPTMKLFLRDINDPFAVFENQSENPFSKQHKKTGGINIIDLANIDSCSFIETQDLGNFHQQDFSVIGRFDNSDVRGCSLMVS